MTVNDFTTAERIISIASKNVNDSEHKNGFSRGWYMSHIQQAMQDLAIESKIFKHHQHEEIPSNLQVTVPKGVIDIREIYVYNGEICNPTSTQVVHWKRLFYNKPSGEGYFARVKDDGSNPDDIFLPNQSNLRRGNARNYRGTKYYYNVDNGVIMLSRDCASYPYIHVVYNGMGGEIGDKPVIPRIFERAIVDFLEERYYNAMKGRNPRTFRVLWGDAQDRLDSPRGAWNKAIRRVKGMDRHQQESMNEYISSMYHK